MLLLIGVIKMNDFKSIPKRKNRILQSTWARLRRQASKFAVKKHKLKKEHDLISKYEGELKQLPKEKRH